MASAPYFDRVLTRDEAKRMLTSIGAKHNPARSQPGILVYTLNGGGEGMVEAKGDKLRVRLFKGRCAC